MCPANPYDELPYKSCSIEWTAPERLAMASLLHGGPQPALDSYRVLELGCGAGGNLIPLAYYRRHATFVGLDGATSQIDVAEARRASLDLANVELIHADFRVAAERLCGQFDYVIAHGIFSWVPDDVRDVLLDLFAQFLRPGGLLYVNYNTRPGWNVRGLVREFLLAQTAGESNLRVRVQRAYDVCTKTVAALDGADHHYSQLLANEFRFVGEGDPSWVAHEYLAPNNRPYWRSEFCALARQYGLEYVADADFNYATGRIPEDLIPKLDVAQLGGRCMEDTVDFLCYRQLHAPILTPSPWKRDLPDTTEFGNFLVASCLEPISMSDNGSHPVFKHPSGYEVEAKEVCIRDALLKLRKIWPRSLPVHALFGDVNQVVDDLKLLQRNGLIELRCVDMGECGIPGGPLNRLEEEWGGYRTTVYHTTELTETFPTVQTDSIA